MEHDPGMVHKDATVPLKEWGRMKAKQSTNRGEEAAWDGIEIKVWYHRQTITGIMVKRERERKEKLIIER